MSFTPSSSRPSPPARLTGWSALSKTLRKPLAAVFTGGRFRRRHAAGAGAVQEVRPGRQPGAGGPERSQCRRRCAAPVGRGCWCYAYAFQILVRFQRLHRYCHWAGAAAGHPPAGELQRSLSEAQPDPVLEQLAHDAHAVVPGVFFQPTRTGPDAQRKSHCLPGW